MEESNIVSINVNINATPSKVWNIITNKNYAKILGAVFDKNAFVDSDWRLGSEVHFKYEPDRIVSTGIVGKWIENELIQVDYDIPGMDYVEKYEIKANGDTCHLSVYAGAYGADFEAQKVVWNNWLIKAKELSEI